MSASICLNMIVKDEARVIGRCLASVRPWITRWMIVDTGSSDGTQDLVRAGLQGIPGELHQRPWRDFGHNRTEALALARGQADYVLIIDADEQLEVPPGFAWPALTADGYQLLHVHAHGASTYWLPKLVADRSDWRWVGVLHEYLDSSTPHRFERLPGPAIRGGFDGGRSVGLSQAEKYARDARVLEQALRDQPDNSRYVFYLAQSYRDAQEPERALDQYRRRARMGGWDEERWAALFEIGKLRQQLGHDVDAVTSAFLEAFRGRPQRAEPLCALARFHRERGEHAAALLYARHAVTIPQPPDHLFLDASVYAWRCRDEFAVASYWAGDCSESARASEELLAGGVLPAAERDRVAANLRLAKAKLATAPATGPAAVFARIYEGDAWDGGSGPGSRPTAIRPYLDYLQHFLKEQRIGSVVDCGCGDWQFSRLIDWSGIQYLGLDVVPQVVARNRHAHSRRHVEFACADFAQADLPPADLVICKDALQHLPDASVHAFLRQLGRFRWALITNDLGPNAGRDPVLAASPWHYAALDITAVPFGVPAREVCRVLEFKVTHLVDRAASAP